MSCRARTSRLRAGLDLRLQRLLDPRARAGSWAPSCARRDGARRPRRRRARRSRRRFGRSDVVVLCGGVSVGAHDHVRPALAALGVQEHFWGVALKPGKPTWFGTRGQHARIRPAGQPGLGDGDLHAARRARAAGARAAARAAPPALEGDARAATTPSRPGRAHAVRCRLRAARRRLAAPSPPATRARTCSPRCSTPTRWRSSPPTAARSARASGSRSSCSLPDRAGPRRCG